MMRALSFVLCLSGLSAFTPALYANEVQRVEFRSLDRDRMLITGLLMRPKGSGPFPAIILLHGCGGLFDRQGGLSKRHSDWADRFVEAGYVVLFPDSFSPRGVKSVCSDRERVVSPSGRAQDAGGAAAWLKSKDFVAANAIGLMGWSNGGSSVLRLVNDVELAKHYSAAVAFYPGCRALARRKSWQPHIPLLIQIGAADDWTPVSFCREMVSKATSGAPRMDVYPGAFHGFDTPDLPLRTRRGVAFSERGDGVVHVGTDQKARLAATQATMNFFFEHLRRGSH